MDEDYERTVGVGPHPEPWPTDPHFDPDLLRDGDRRNVGDEYRYWTVEAIVADLDLRRHDFHIAMENLEHDFNIGSVVRTANAFNASTRRSSTLESTRCDGDEPVYACGISRFTDQPRRMGR